MTSADPSNHGEGSDLTAAIGPAPSPNAPLQIALIALASDHGIRGEMELLLGRRAELHLARVTAPDSYDLASLAATAGTMGRALDWMGAGACVDVAAYGCTSATVVVGEDSVKRRLRRALPHVRCTTPITAALAALDHLGARRIALLSPYPEPIHGAVARYLADRGLHLVDQATLGIATDRAITDYPAEGLRARILGLDRREADAIFVSCTSLRIVRAICQIETATGLPLVTSNQALAWHCLKLAGRSANIPGFGQLLAADCP